MHCEGARFELAKLLCREIFFLSIKSSRIFYRLHRKASAFRPGLYDADGKTIFVSLASSLGACVGYIPFGLYTLQHLHDFWAPFHAQQYWNRTFGWHFNLIFSPSSVGGSGHVLFWDLLAFYLPVLLVVYGIYIPKIAGSFKRFGFWVGVSTGLINSGIAFFTYPIFMSTSRHLFALPLIFYSLGIVIDDFFTRRPQGTKKVLWISVWISLLFYLRFWARFAKGSWIE